MKTLGQMAEYFGKLAGGAYRAELEPVLDLIGAQVKAEVENEIGEYQSSIGPFPETAALADSTIESKERNGLGKSGNADSPLWATGKYHDSIQTHKDAGALAVEIGTNEKEVIFHELGTKDMPPRPIFGPATLRALPPLLPKIAEAGIAGIVGGAWSGLGITGVTHTPIGDSAEVQP